jgi:ABC-2 type transport system permease protein
MTETILRILALARKELLAILKDPRGRFSLFVPPVLQCLIFGYAATYDLNTVPYAVLDQDRSFASSELLARVDGSPAFRRGLATSDSAAFKRAIAERRALIGIQIPPGFERDLLLGRPADVQLIADGRDSNTANTAAAYVEAAVGAFNASWLGAHGGTSPAARATTRVWYNPNLETRWTMIPSLIGTLTMLQTLLLTAMSVAREREEGTFDQLLVTPYRPGEIMAGKALPSVLIGAVQATNILLVAQLWFRIPFAGSFLTLYAGLAVFLAAAVGMGLLVSSVAATMQQAMLYSFAVTIPFSLLSGLTTPIANMPAALQVLTLVNPLRYTIDLTRRIYLEGAGLGVLWPDLWPLALIAAVTLPAAAWMFRHRLT